MKPRVVTGLERLASTRHRWLKGARIGLLCNQASVTSSFCHAKEVIQDVFSGQLSAIFSPQHGFYSEKQDNMIESRDFIDPRLDIPVISLYGTTRRPTMDMMELIDVLVVDLQDVGTRVYTFASTLAYCMEAAGRFNKKLLVLDRPNPINGTATEGNLLDPSSRSFVGLFPIPMRHGLTIGELAILFNTEYGVSCDLDVIPMEGWERWMFFADTQLPWIAPSPNLPNTSGVLLYPGQVLWEGTNVSEARGTTQPFEQFGAPFIEPDILKKHLDEGCTTGVALRPIVFEPTSNKWQGRACSGFFIHVTDPATVRPYRLGIALLKAIISSCPRDFKWKDPPYEYEFEKSPIDLIIGDKKIRTLVEDLLPVRVIETAWKDELAEFNRLRKGVFLYKDNSV